MSSDGTRQWTVEGPRTERSGLNRWKNCVSLLHHAPPYPTPAARELLAALAFLPGPTHQAPETFIGQI